MVKPFDLLAQDTGTHLANLRGGLVFVYLLLGTAAEALSFFFLIASTTWLAMSSMFRE
jgi:hypothetical protein